MAFCAPDLRLAANLFGAVAVFAQASRHVSWTRITHARRHRHVTNTKKREDPLTLFRELIKELWPSSADGDDADALG